MGLEQYVIDMLEADEAGLAASGLDQCAAGQVHGVSEDALARACDQCEGVFSEGVERESCALKLIEDEATDGFVGEFAQERGVANARADILIDGKLYFAQ